MRNEAHTADYPRQGRGEPYVKSRLVSGFIINLSPACVGISEKTNSGG